MWEGCCWGWLGTQLFSNHIEVAKCVWHKITHIEITSGITFIITPIITSHINSCEISCKD